jgi:lipooligosaccharide transport system permease protein
MEGLSYLSFVRAEVLAFTVLMRSIFELTYGAYFRMVYQSTYEAILATPVTVESLAFGEIIYGVTKGAIDCVVILIIVVIFGAAGSFFTPLAVVPLLMGCFFLGCVPLGFTPHIFEIDYFNFFFAVFFSTIFLCGVWFPISLLPNWLQILAYILPQTSVVEITKACLSGNFAWTHLYEIIYLLTISVVCLEWSLRSLRKRMVD